MRSNGRFIVAVVQTGNCKYPTKSPYHPSSLYPEYPFPPNVSQEANSVYDGVRQLFKELKLDASHSGSAKWNPLGGVVKPGMTVVIKPNLVLDSPDITYVIHNVPLLKRRCNDVFSIVTHPSVVRAVLDYTWIALRGDGKIFVADAPNYNCDFRHLMDITRLLDIAKFLNEFKGPVVEVLDLRNYWSKTRHFASLTHQLAGDPKGSVTVNLGKDSAFFGHGNPSAFYGAVYDRDETIRHHSGERQEYELSRTVLSADAIISVPKLKTHGKVGVTCNLKNLVGACTNKNYLVHYTLGSPSEGGDQYPDGLFSKTELAAVKFERWMYDKFLAKRTRRRELVHRLLYGVFYIRVLRHLGFDIPYEKRRLDAGNWHGNDTAWRMAADLAKILHFADQHGKLHKEPQRPLFSVIDGILAGENEGPLVPDTKQAGILIGGSNLLAVDLVAARLMGFDPSKIKQFAMLDLKYNLGPKDPSTIQVRSNVETFESPFSKNGNRFLAFTPHPGWAGKIEI
jgi:uncharacterized protein (DUF362 family)